MRDDRLAPTRLPDGDEVSTDYGLKYETARDRVFALLADCRWHSRTELEHVAGNRYTARVLELRRLGYRISAVPQEDGDGKAYRLESTELGSPQPKRVKVLMDEEDAAQLVAGTVSDGARAAVGDALGSFRENRTKL